MSPRTTGVPACPKRSRTGDFSRRPFHPERSEGYLFPIHHPVISRADILSAFRVQARIVFRSPRPVDDGVKAEPGFEETGLCRLVDEHKEVGIYRVTRNARYATSGVYLCRMEAQGFNRSVKLFLVK